MRLKSYRWALLLCLLPLWGLQTAGQSAAETGAAAKLFTRYETGAGRNRLAEDVLTLTLSVAAPNRAVVAIRVCSKEPTPFALATAGADPFHIAQVLRDSYGYLPEQVVYLRSEDCLPPGASSEPVTEVWAGPRRASLPPHVEAFTSDRVRLTRLGEKGAGRGVKDYEPVLRKLIQDLRLNPSAVGVVFGYFLEHPSPGLQRRLREVTRTLEQSGLPRERFLVRPKAWDDEFSTHPPDLEPKYPSLFVIEIGKASAGVAATGSLTASR